MKIDLSVINKVLHEQEDIVQDIREKRRIKEHFIQSNIIIIFCTLVFGGALGSFVDGEQVLINSVKIPLLFLVTLYISLPIFYILESILGSRIEVSQMTLILLTGYVVAAIIMLAFTPLMLFFILTAKEYYFTVFLTIGIMGLAGYFSLYYIYKSFRMFHDDNKWYPSFVVGSFVIAFVGTQLSWVLRPFFHSSDAFTRPTDGNFYVAMWEAAGNEPGLASALFCSFGLIAFIITILMFMNSNSPNPSGEGDGDDHYRRPYRYYHPPQPAFVPVHPSHYPVAMAKAGPPQQSPPQTRSPPQSPPVQPTPRSPAPVQTPHQSQAGQPTSAPAVPSPTPTTNHSGKAGSVSTNPHEAEPGDSEEDQK